MKSKAEFEGFESIECVEVHIKIFQMFMNLSPQLVQKTKREINPHLIECSECRALFYAKWDEAQKQFAEKKVRMSEG